ncbi:Rieske 2Fe-2S domain-containing protein [Actinophytocola oryzae]|nr:Rieske 2Fe-2S domain-containing protein [Actinophytocola oryzae]
MTEWGNLVDRVARAQVLDKVAGMVRDAVHAVVRPGVVKDAAHGVWLGHPLHPALAQLPLGCYTGAALLDLTGAPDSGSSRLIGLGLLSSAPAAMTGLVDYADSHEEQQRIGVVHASANSAALACYVSSLLLRRSGRTKGGVAAGLLGYAFAMLGATLGGDLAFRRAVGANHAAEVPHTGPEEWCDLGAVTDFADGKPARRQAGLIPVMVVSSGDGFTVLHDRCSHMAAPLNEGDLVEVAGESCVECPWHGSVFRLRDGAVVHGPATAPQPVLDWQVAEGRLRAKVRTIPGVPAS